MIEVTVLNQPGVLAGVARIIGESDANIDNVRMTRRAADFTEMLIDLEVWDAAHLNAILTRLRSEPVVNKVVRKFGQEE